MKKKYMVLGIVIILVLVMLTIFLVKLPYKIDIKHFSIVKKDSTDVVNDSDDNIVKSSTENLKPESCSATIPIFMYHWVREDTGGYEYPEMMVKTSEIKKQFEYLSANGYNTIFITDLDKIYEYSKPVALTFDDGWADVYNNVFPYAKEYNIKISMYVIKDLVGTSGYCTEEQLEEMIESGLVDVQSHTVTHRKLATLSESEMYNELSVSKDYLKERFGIDSKVICYPSGSYNDTTIKVAKELGYEYGLAMDGGIHYTDKYDNMKIARIFATRSMSLDTFINYISKASVNVKWE